MPIAAPRIGFNQQVVGVLVVRHAVQLPPQPDRGHRKFGCRGTGADIDEGVVGDRVVNSVRDCLALGVARKVVGAELLPRGGSTKEKRIRQMENRHRKRQASIDAGYREQAHATAMAASG